MKKYKCEVWKDIKGYEGLYQVSNFGRVKSLPRFRIGKSNSLVPINESIMKDTISNRGYNIISLCKNGKYKTLTIHSLVAKAFIPNSENLPEVNHKDGDKTNNNDWNLEWVTSSENKKHAHKIGLCNQIGEKNANHKLTKKDVLEIRAKYVPWKYSLYKLANEYNVNDETIRAIIKNRSWVF